MNLTSAPLGSIRRLLVKRHDVAALVDPGREVGKDCGPAVNIRRQLRLAVNESARIKSQSIRPDWNPDHARRVGAGARRSEVRR